MESQCGSKAGERVCGKQLVAILNLILVSPLAEQSADENDLAPAACCPPRSTAGEPLKPNGCFLDLNISQQKVATLETLCKPPVYSRLSNFSRHLHLQLLFH